MTEARQVFRAVGYPTDPPSTSWVSFCPQCGTRYMPEPGSSSPASCAACGHRRFRSADPAVSVLVSDGERVVLCRRTPSSFQGGRWCLPCGFVDFDEDFLTAGRREVREETGLNVAVRSILSVVTNRHTPALHTLVIVLEASVIDGDLMAGDDADRAEWFVPSALPDLAFEADDHIIARYFAEPGFGAPVDPRFAHPADD